LSEKMIGAFVKSLKTRHSGESRSLYLLKRLDSGFRRNDEGGVRANFCEYNNDWLCNDKGHMGKVYRRTRNTISKNGGCVIDV
jgi:hypothetical protein